MPLTQMGLTTVSGNLDERIRPLLEKMLGILDERIAAIARDKGTGDTPGTTEALSPL